MVNFVIIRIICGNKGLQVKYSFFTKKICKKYTFVKSSESYFLKRIWRLPNTPIDSEILTYIININYLKYKEY